MGDGRLQYNFCKIKNQVLNIPKSYCNNKYIDSYLFSRNIYHRVYIKGVGVDRRVGHIFKENLNWVGGGQVLLVDRKGGSANIASGNGLESGGYFQWTGT